MRSFRPAVLGALLVLLAWAWAHEAAAVAVDIEVPAAQSRAARLRNLPAEAVLNVRLETDGQIRVRLVQAADTSRTLFEGAGDETLSFTVKIPAAGEYLVVVDNPDASESRKVTVTIGAARPEVTLTEFQRSLQRLFVVEPFPIRIKRCGRPAAFAGAGGVVLCAEYAERLRATLGDAAKASDALLFTLFHELGHVLLAQWKYPFHDNEEVADEFATALMVMTGQRARVYSKAEFFAKNPSAAEALAKVTRDDRHPISAQRARNIIRWADDPELVRKWQPIFVPHMQTAVLKRLLAKSPAWLDRSLVEQELARR